MEKHFDINEEGYSIRAKMITSDKDKGARTFPHIVIVTHGFDSSKETSGTVKFGEHLTAKYKGFTVVAFDWPCHGADARKKLTVAECLTYLSLVIAYAKKELGADDICIYSSSFGAYLTLRYIVEKENPFRKIALRCPAIRMLDTMTASIPETDREKLEKGKEIQIGFDRKMKIDQGFLDELAAFQVPEHEYFDFADDMMILHGTKDERVPIDISRAFAEDNVITFLPVEGANHPFQNPDHMAFAIHNIVKFFKPEENQLA